MKPFFEQGKMYRVVVMDMNASERTMTFSVSLNNLSGRYPLRKEIEMRGELINVLLAAVNRKEIVENRNGYPTVVGYTEEPRFAITPVGMDMYPTEAATIITPGIAAPAAADDPPMPEEEEEEKEEEKENGNMNFTPAQAKSREDDAAEPRGRKPGKAAAERRR